jgi:hypothetical protein
MAKTDAEEVTTKHKTKVSAKVTNNNYGPLGYVMFVAYIGAAVYFVRLSDGFWGFLLALLKAAVWPAYVMHNVLGLLNVR